MSTTDAIGPRPVIELATAVPGVFLRASVDQKGVVFAALVHPDTDAHLSIVAHHWALIRPAAHAGGSALQLGTTVLLLANNEAARFFCWLRGEDSNLTGEA